MAKDRQIYVKMSESQFKTEQELRNILLQVTEELKKEREKKDISVKIYFQLGNSLLVRDVIKIEKSRENVTIDIPESVHTYLIKELQGIEKENENLRNINTQLEHKLKVYDNMSLLQRLKYSIWKR
jgi:hypothetical protein